MLPQKFLERMETQLGDEYPAFLQSLERTIYTNWQKRAVGSVAPLLWALFPKK